MASGRQQSLISRKKRKKAKVRRREGQEAPQEYSVFASSFVFCGSLVFFRLLPAFVAGKTKYCSFAGGGNSQFLAGDGWAPAPSPPGPIVRNEPNLAGRPEPRRAKCAKRTQFGPRGQALAGPNVRNEPNFGEISSFKCEAGRPGGLRAQGPIVQNEAKLAGPAPRPGPRRAKCAKRTQFLDCGLRIGDRSGVSGPRRPIV